MQRFVPFLESGRVVEGRMGLVLRLTPERKNFEWVSWDTNKSGTADASGSFRLLILREVGAFFGFSAEYFITIIVITNEGMINLAKRTKV